MIICQNCGVELESNMNFCPLCGYPAETDASPEHEPVHITNKTDARPTYVGRLNRPQKRKLVWEVASLILLSGVAVVTLINLILDQAITWAAYPILFSLILYGYITAFYFFTKKRWRLLASTFGITLIMLFFIDYMHNNLQWFLSIAFPLLVAAYGIGISVYFFTRAVKFYGFLLIANIFISIGGWTLLLEALLSYKQTQQINLEWSLILLISIIPVAAILYYIHFRLKKNPDLRKFFHI